MEVGLGETSFSGHGKVDEKAKEGQLYSNMAVTVDSALLCLYYSI